jgi:2-hydroxychromene-2-carboxylate isomerase
MTEVHFWYEFASTYSYPATMRIEQLAAERGLALRWRPFILGPIFAEQGWRNSPFNLYPNKGRYMWRDLERICARLSLPFQRPEPFPQNSLLAARTVLALEPALRPPFSKAVFLAQFGEGKAIAERSVIAAILQDLGEAPAFVLEKALSEPIRTQLKMETDAAQRLGIFGAPAVVTDDGEMFWGNDRLEEALDWALHGR